MQVTLCYSISGYLKFYLKKWLSNKSYAFGNDFTDYISSKNVDLSIRFLIICENTEKSPHWELHFDYFSIRNLIPRQDSLISHRTIAARWQCARPSNTNLKISRFALFLSVPLSRLQWNFLSWKTNNYKWSDSSDSSTLYKIYSSRFDLCY